MTKGGGGDDGKVSLTLSDLYVRLRPSLRTLSVLHSVSVAARSVKGGALLNAVSDLAQTRFLGDDVANGVLRHLLSKAGEPYVVMLKDWLIGGTLQDPYEEFMIGDNRRKSGDVPAGDGEGGDWNSWFVLRSEHVLSDLKMDRNPGGVASGDGVGGVMGRRVMPPLLSAPSLASAPLEEEDVDLPTKVLLTGKYWNAVWLCRGDGSIGSSVGQDDDSAAGDDGDGPASRPLLAYGNEAMSPVRLTSYVGQSYERASDTLLSLMLNEHRLMSALWVVKRYFLLDQGDFFVHFLDMAEDELLGDMARVSRARVQGWLAISVALSCGGREDDRADDHVVAGADGKLRPRDLITASSLRCDFATESLVDLLDDIHAKSGGMGSREPRTPSRHLYGAADDGGLTGVEAVMLDFHRVPFPTSLVLSRRSVSNYQLLFRHLFFAKHVERRLVGTWLDHQAVKTFQSLRGALGPTFSLRQRMLHFVQNLVYYMIIEVIEPNWRRMEDAVLRTGAGAGPTREAEGSNIGAGSEGGYRHRWRGHSRRQTVDDVLRAHNEFLRRTLKECLLTNRDLIRTLTKLMTTCLLFSDQMKLFMETTKIVSHFFTTVNALFQRNCS